jgi:hypothetical protein
MPSTSAIPTSEKKRKSTKSSSKSKKSSSKYDDSTATLSEPVKSTKKKSRSASKKLKDQLPLTEDETPDDITEGEEGLNNEAAEDATTTTENEVTDEVEQQGNDITNQANDVVEQANDEVTDKLEEANDQVGDGESEELIEEARNKVAQIVGNDSDDEEGEGDADALTTMNAIMEYNRMLVQRFQELEEKTGGFSKNDVQGTVKDTMDDLQAKYNKKEEPKGTRHSFELPIGDMMKGYANYSSTPLPEAEEKQEPTKKQEDEESTVKGDDDGKIRIGDGEKDDIVVKVDATKTGITFSIHIPRN